VGRQGGRIENDGEKQLGKVERVRDCEKWRL
jgi:hypothetical protein